jgi:hypothetical protein
MQKPLVLLDMHDLYLVFDRFGIVVVKFETGGCASDFVGSDIVGGDFGGVGGNYLEHRFLTPI